MGGDFLAAALAERPEDAALLLDIDGVLAPIVVRPEDARVPDATRAELERLASRYALVACVSGRTGEDAAHIVGVEAIVYVGCHGLELEPGAAAWVPTLRELAASVDWPVEDKGLTVSFHYRDSPDEAVARAFLERVASRAREAGLVARFGRKVLELVPPVRANKGTAVVRLLRERRLRRALYAGDDTTDLDAFSALEKAGLELAVRVAVASPEGPPELAARADLVVDGPEGLVALLARL